MEIEKLGAEVTRILNKEKNTEVLWEADPAFRFAKVGEKKEDYLLKFPGKETLTYFLLDPATGTGVADKKFTLALQER